jgi:hypothetical protein
MSQSFAVSACWPYSKHLKRKMLYTAAFYEGCIFKNDTKAVNPVLVHMRKLYIEFPGTLNV